MATALDLGREREKLSWLREKVAAQERLVQELERLFEQCGGDLLDALFEQEKTAELVFGPSGPTSSAPTAAAVSEEAGSRSDDEAEPTSTRGRLLYSPAPPAWTRPVRRLPPHWRRILKFIGRDGKSASQVHDFITANGILKWETIRSGLMSYRREHGLLESHRRGYYRLTPSGMAIITATEDESPARQGEASESQPPEKEVTEAA